MNPSEVLRRAKGVAQFYDDWEAVWGYLSSFAIEYADGIQAEKLVTVLVYFTDILSNDIKRELKPEEIDRAIALAEAEEYTESSHRLSRDRESSRNVQREPARLYDNDRPD